MCQKCIRFVSFSMLLLPLTICIAIVYDRHYIPTCTAPVRNTAEIGLHPVSWKLLREQRAHDLCKGQKRPGGG